MKVLKTQLTLKWWLRPPPPLGTPRYSDTTDLGFPAPTGRSVLTKSSPVYKDALDSHTGSCSPCGLFTREVPLQCCGP